MERKREGCAMRRVSKILRPTQSVERTDTANSAVSAAHLHSVRRPINLIRDPKVRRP